jgi:hypothetical protein
MDVLDEKTDVYSLGIIAYEMLYGEPPVVSTSLGELFALQMFGPPPVRERMPDLDPRLADLILRLLHKKPADRPSMDAALRELEAVTSTGLRDGALADRPAARRQGSADGVAAGEDPGNSQMIRGLLNHSTGSRGEKQAASTTLKRTRYIVAGASAGLALMLVSALFLLRPYRAASTAPAAVTAAAPLAAPAAAPDLGQSAAASAAKEALASPAPASEGSATTIAKAAPAKSEGPTRSSKDRTSRKGSRRGAKDAKSRVELWN